MLDAQRLGDFGNRQPLLGQGARPRGLRFRGPYFSDAIEAGWPGVGAWRMRLPPGQLRWNLVGVNYLWLGFGPQYDLQLGGHGHQVFRLLNEGKPSLL
jgi:hypothetical protein